MPELHPDPPPSLIAYLWNWFLDLNIARTAGMEPNPITYQDFSAWSDVTGIRLSPWEVRVLKRLDSAFMTSLKSED